jgi:YVTN family beta-propeller protein
MCEEGKNMGDIYVCNTSSDCISKINVDTFKEECRLKFTLDSSSKVGPHGICAYNEELLIANNYNNSLSIIDMDKNLEKESYFIGMHCNDVVVYDNTAYIVCGESNCAVLFSLSERKIIEQIPCGNLPHSISLCREKRLALISNMQSDSITLVDCDNRENTKNINVGCYPTKALFSVDGQYILVCESNIGSYYRGSISIISVKTLKLVNRVMVGKYPVDMCCDERYCYVSNFGEGSVSIVDINSSREVRKITTGGMPRGIVKSGRHIYIGDNYNNMLIELDMENENKRKIPIGGEPTGMILLIR